MKKKLLRAANELTFYKERVTLLQEQLIYQKKNEEKFIRVSAVYLALYLKQRPIFDRRPQGLATFAKGCFLLLFGLLFQLALFVSLFTLRLPLDCLMIRRSVPTRTEWSISKQHLMKLVYFLVIDVILFGEMYSSSESSIYPGVLTEIPSVDRMIGGERTRSSRSMEASG